MKHLIKSLFLFLVAYAMNNSFALAQTIFQKTFGDKIYADEDNVRPLQLTSDGGYVIAMSSLTVLDSMDIYLLKFDNNNVLQWQKNYGGSGDDIVNSV